MRPSGVTLVPRRRCLAVALCAVFLAVSPLAAEGFGAKKPVKAKGARGSEEVAGQARQPFEPGVFRAQTDSVRDPSETPNGMSQLAIDAKRRTERYGALPSNRRLVSPPQDLLRRPEQPLPPGGPESLRRLLRQQSEAIFGGTFQAVTATGSIPPDPTMAAGPYNLIAATNGAVNVLRKNGTLISNTGLAAFFGQSDNTFDPKTLFDQYLQRFWVIAVSRNPNPSNAAGTQRSTLNVALSNTDDATEGWQVFSMDAKVDGSDDSDNWCDYPQIGIDMNHVYFTCNMFEFDASGFDYSKIRVMTKSQFVNNTCCAWYDFWDMVDVFRNAMTIQPAHMYGAGPSTPMFLANAHGQGADDNELSLWQINNAGSCCGAAGDPELEGENYTVGSWTSPPNANQSGSTTDIDTGDTRLLWALWKDGRFATGQNSACNDDDDVCWTYTELNLSGGIDDASTINDFIFGLDGTDFWFPQVSVNAADDRAVVYAKSSSSTFAGAFALGIPSSSDCTNCTEGPEQTVLGGAASYVSLDSRGRNRWGDYFGASADPDGTGIWVHGQAAVAGNNWQTNVALLYENLDTTPPVTTYSLEPVPNGAGWNKTDVFLTIQATDSGSGVRFVDYSATGADPIAPARIFLSTFFLFDNAEGITTYSVSATDNWGNVETPAKTQVVRIDKSLPVVNCGTADGLWHADNVAINCTASDVGPSGLANPADASFQLVTSVPAGTETANAFTNSRQVCDKAGNCVTAGPIGGNKIDRKAPTITITVPSALPVYLLNQPVPSLYGCADGGSGVATCAGPVASGANLDSASVGIKTFTVNATDQVGNASSASETYYVTYNICLLYDPLKQHASNSVLPVLFNLCDYYGVSVSDPSIVVTATSVTPPGVLQSAGNTNPGNVFQYLNKGGYVYNLSLKGYASGDYALVFQAVGDPVNHQAPFKVK